MSTLFAVAIGVAVLHKTTGSIAGQIVAGVCIILIFLACLLAFAHSWYNIGGRNTYPSILCSPKYGGLQEKDGEDDQEMDTAQAIKKRKQKEEALAGVMPSNKPNKAVEKSSSSEEVDSSLQSSSSASEDDSEAPAEEDEDSGGDEPEEESEGEEQSEGDEESSSQEE